MRKEIEPLPSIKCRIESALSSYIANIKNLGLIDTVILGIEHDESRAYIFHVLKEDIHLQDASDHRYAMLTRLGGQLQQTLLPEVPTRVSYVNPSRVDELRRECDRRKIDTLAVTLEALQSISA